MSAHTGARIPQLDGIRGIAILLVLLWHYLVSNVSFSLGPFQWAWSGVDLFFVLSGFLIGGILLDHRETINYFRVFYVRRVCRILHLYHAWLILFILLVAWVPIDTVFADPIPLWSYLSFTQNIIAVLTVSLGPAWLVVTWSLAIEEQFYLILPLLIRRVSLRSLPYTCLTVVAVVPILRSLIILIPPHSAFPNYALTPCVILRELRGSARTRV